MQISQNDLEEAWNRSIFNYQMWNMATEVAYSELVEEALKGYWKSEWYPVYQLEMIIEQFEVKTMRHVIKNTEQKISAYSSRTGMIAYILEGEWKLREDNMLF